MSWTLCLFVAGCLPREPLYQSLQDFVDLGLADNVWQEKGAAIVATVDSLGDKLKPELCAGWLAYIRETYQDGAGAAAAAPSVGEDTFGVFGTV